MARRTEEDLAKLQRELQLEKNIQHFHDESESYIRHLLHRMEKLNPVSLQYKDTKEKYDIVVKLHKTTGDYEDDDDRKIEAIRDIFTLEAQQKLIKHSDAPTKRYLLAAAVFFTGIVPGLILLPLYSKFFSGQNSFCFWRSHGACFVNNTFQDQVSFKKAERNFKQ